MRKVQDAPLGIIELPKKQAQARDKKSDVPGGNDDRRLSSRIAVAQVLQKQLRRPQMLDNIQQEHRIHGGVVRGDVILVDIHADGFHRVLPGLGRDIGIDRDYPDAALGQFPGHKSGATAQVQHGRSRGNMVQGKSVGTGVA